MLPDPGVFVRRFWPCRRGLFALLATVTLCGTRTLAQTPPADDPYLWLEDVTGDKALAWVKERNTESLGELTADPDYERLQTRILDILDSNAKIPTVVKIGEHYYNFWRDKTHERGLWRRTSLEEYRKEQPAWETVLDLDALGKAENENWVWHGAEALPPENQRALLSLSRGGADADVVREFDLTTKQFIADGFNLPESKSNVSWCDRDRVYVAVAFDSSTMTTSGYARIVKEWKRGTPLESATLVYEGKTDDVGVNASRDHTPGFERDFVTRWPTFFTSEVYLRRDGKLIKIDKPDDVDVSVHHEWLLLSLRKPWTVGGRTWPAGALLAVRFDDFLAGKRDFQMLFEPTERKSLAEFISTQNGLILTELDNVKNRLYALRPTGDTWARAPIAGLPDFGAISAKAVDKYESDAFFLTITDFLTPTGLYYGNVGDAAPERLKQTPAFFKADGLVVTQHEAVSKDGTHIPYFLVARSDLRTDGNAPTLLNGYGGFEVAELPSYSGTRGAAWLEKGGVFALANIRGGGEFGPTWHEAAVKANRHHAYEDFIAVAEDLVNRKVTSPPHLACIGGSNGGLLVGNMLTMRPDLFGAIVCQVPLLDMQRYHKLLAGASWMGEYGDPDDPAEWKFIQTFSPYQNVKQGGRYPRTLFTTSTRDDRVHPGHARKMVAKMKAQGHDVLYYENIEGGHGGAANNKQAATMWALAYTFLWQELTGTTGAAR